MKQGKKVENFLQKMSDDEQGWDRMSDHEPVEYMSDDREELAERVEILEESQVS
jgi:hypothetical protein